MVKTHPHAEATYRVVPQKDGAFGVEVTVPGSQPTMITSFASPEAAEEWIAKHKREIEEYPSRARGGFRFKRH